MYPLKKDLRDTDIPRWLAECELAGLIAIYTVDSKQYLLFHKLGAPRAKKSKFPPPSVNGCAQPQTSVNGCLQTQTSAPYSDSGTDSRSGASAGSGRAPDPAEFELPDFGPPAVEMPPTDLVHRWYLGRHGPPVSVPDVAGSIENLRAAGMTDPEIMAEIDAPDRIKGQWPRQWVEAVLRKRKSRPKASGFGAALQTELAKNGD